ncbi:sigma 54-interacting transcriptional regulator, partial [Myxococcota bacterium]|nr:sigma 54-interacting transcriptional regulator [Myxococcota bacterium]
MGLAVAMGRECQQGGGCGCAHLLDCDARDAARRVASRLAPSAAIVHARWAALLAQHGEPAAGWPESSVVALLDALAASDAPIVSSLLLGEAQALRARGVRIHTAMLASQLLWDTLRDVASDVDGGRTDAATIGALLRLAGLHGSLVGLAYGAVSLDAPSRAPAATERVGLSGLVGASKAMERLYGRIELAARGRETVLVVGESGVGKELVARAVHRVSGDPEGRFVAVNCAALPAELVESELFGHRRGAFSGAASEHAGLVRAADGGTLFLDEITELAPAAQAKLLRVIQERTVRPVGAIQEEPVRVRIVAATNRSLREATDGGVLRRDLYYRLQRVVIDVPPLRERMSDLPLLVAAFAERWAEAYGAPRPKVFSEETLERLLVHAWPGNVRELENVVFAACLASRGAV